MVIMVISPDFCQCQVENLDMRAGSEGLNWPKPEGGQMVWEGPYSCLWFLFFFSIGLFHSMFILKCNECGIMFPIDYNLGKGGQNDEPYYMPNASHVQLHVAALAKEVPLSSS